MTPIVPAIIPKSEDDIFYLLPRLSFSSEIHIDVVDGDFVPFTSWPYFPLGKPKDIHVMTDHLTLEVDLMVDNPLIAADDWLEAGADMLVFHVENISVEAFTRFADSTKVSVGIATTSDTPFSILEPYLKVADYLQLMGIAKVGAQGQPFDERVLDKIKEIKKSFPNLSISVDGSVNKDTILKIYKAGADRFICGSAIVSADEPYLAYRELQKLIN